MSEVVKINVCRVCLCNDQDNMESLLRPGTTGAHDYLGKMFSECTNIKVLENDGLPEFICLNCTEELIAASIFVQKARDSNEMWQKLLVKEATITIKNTKDLKQEDMKFEKGEVQVEMYVDKIQEEEFEYQDANDDFFEDFEDNEEKPFAEPLEIINEEISPKTEEDKLNYLITIPIEDPYCCCCYKTFPNEEELEMHSQMKHVHQKIQGFGKNSVKCSRCNRFFTSNKEFDTHINNMQNETEFLDCKLCGARFLKSRLKSALTHIRLHFKPKRNPNKTMIRAFDYDYARKQYGYLCCGQGCSKSYENENDLVEHAHKEHIWTKMYNDKFIKTKPFECTICFRRFDKAFTLDKHQKRKYKAQSTAIPCELCGMKIFRADIEVHRATHKQEKQFICDICEKSFYTKAKIKAHISTHSEERPFKCHICKTRFKKKGYLDTHLKLHLNLRSFICKICPSKFSTRKALDIHERVHTGERPYKCNYCEWAFSDKRNRDVHEISHTGKYPYHCKTCGKGFKRKSFLNQHKHRK